MLNSAYAAAPEKPTPRHVRSKVFCLPRQINADQKGAAVIRTSTVSSPLKLVTLVQSLDPGGIVLLVPTED